MDREFIAERQKGLQAYLNHITRHHVLSSCELVKKFLDTNTYSANYTGNTTRVYLRLDGILCIKIILKLTPFLFFRNSLTAGVHVLQIRSKMGGYWAVKRHWWVKLYSCPVKCWPFPSNFVLYYIILMYYLLYYLLIKILVAFTLTMTDQRRQPWGASQL